MQPLDYCQDKAAPPGSDRYYALRMAAPDRRADLLALHTYHAEIMAIPLEVSDPGVASVKLNWWREELDRIFSNQARHPAGQLLQETVRRHGLPREPFTHIQEAAAMDLEYGAYPSFRELSVYCHHSGGALMQLLVTVRGYTEEATLAFAHDLGMALTLDDRLHHLRAHALAGRSYIPEDEMRVAGVHRDDFLQPQGQEQLRELLAQQGERVLEFLQQAEQRLPRDDAPAQRSQLVLAALARTL
ncbi:MAG: squalene/phytoene synthase family protein [Ectothiorhodospiraceae bacterium]|nr:squalene/phytoene synthase family protein [Ectothiorhodospiraceae bacterium]